MGLDAEADAKATYDYDADIQPIFDASCTSCHSGSSPSRGLDLSTGMSWGELVNVPAEELASMDRVEPGSPSTSYLFHKVRGTQATVGGSGQRMPPGGPYLTAAQIGILSTWITEGAEGPATACTDADGDGWCVEDDCDDADASVNPDGVEIADDGIDQDCDGADLVGTPTYTYDYDVDIQGVWNTYCVSCHTGGTAPLGLDLTAGASYDLLVDVPASQLATMDRVEPGAATSSYLYRKMAGTHRIAGGTGNRMPPSVMLPAGVLSMVQVWIDEGANGPAGGCTDADADGWCVEDDCDDADASVNPDAEDVAGDGIDQDCDGADAVAYTYSLSADVQPIFDASCTSCHSGGTAPLGLMLTAGSSWAETVGVPASQLATMDLVEPGSPTMSYLYRKVAGTHRIAGGTGNRMPPTGPLSSAQLLVISTWITEGAPDN